MSASADSAKEETTLAARLTLSGAVQGIGMRPAIVRWAQELALTGYVCNTPEGVELHIQGPRHRVERFEQELERHLPATAGITAVSSVPVELEDCEEFIINLQMTRQRESPLQARTALSTSVPHDRVVCAPCLSEIQEGADRRHEYPFVSCTDCGPRYSIIERMPFERADTSMAGFSLCETCRHEFQSPRDRRFHAQTNACPRCGPHVWLRNAENRIVARGSEALRGARNAILEDRIVALRGIGGYQLLVDATSSLAVQRLRRLKRRLGKPLAVMVASQTDASRLARLNDQERGLLSSPEGPIVIVSMDEAADIATCVTSGLGTIGLMMPTTPLHWLLLNKVMRPLVCTSGNREGDPLAYEAATAHDQLRGVADVWLEHDRDICRPIDDSLVRVVAGRPVTIRLGRGYAPLPLELPAGPPQLALGGHLKTSIALSNGAQAVLGPHVGDLETVETRQRWMDQVGQLTALYGVGGDRQLVCDQHPEYFTSQWAERQPGGPLQVQHHHAHVVAGMLEHRWLDRQVLGISFDGTGFSSDGTIWGGEFLLATSDRFQRVGHLRAFSLIGGEQAIRQPWRVAAALVADAMGEEAAAQLKFASGAARPLLPLLNRVGLTHKTTSAGRLFDGMACLILGVEYSRYEGEAAMLLESACQRSETGKYDFGITRHRPAQVDWRPLVKQVMKDRAKGVCPGDMAMRFHRGLADAIFRFCRTYPSLPVVLGGGVFQNRILTELLVERFDETQQPLGPPGWIPPNDGGLAAGQLAIAAATLQTGMQACV